MEILDIPLSNSPYIYFNPNPAIQDLLDNFKTIKKEFMKLATHFHVTKTIYKLDDFPDDNSTNKTNQYDKMYTGKFKSIQLLTRDTLLDYLEKKTCNWEPNEKIRVNKNLRLVAPFHVKYMLKYMDILGAVTYNISYPGSNLKHHFGLDKDYIRVHLCIHESKDCVFDIENWRHVWKEGEVFGFDDYYVFHGTNHSATSTTPRSILMLDIKKTYLQEYATSWPIRNTRLNKHDFLEANPLRGWDS